MNDKIEQSWSEFRKQYIEYCNQNSLERYAGTFRILDVEIKYIGWKRYLNIIGNTPEQNRAIGPKIILIGIPHGSSMCHDNIQEAKRSLAMHYMLNKKENLDLYNENKTEWKRLFDQLASSEIEDMEFNQDE